MRNSSTKELRRHFNKGGGVEPEGVEGDERAGDDEANVEVGGCARGCGEAEDV